MIIEPVVSWVQTVHLSYIDTTVSKWMHAIFQTTHITYEFHRVCLKLVTSIMVNLEQTMHLSCIKTNTISKQTEMSFLFCLIT
jgi:hypothetical protein